MKVAGSPINAIDVNAPRVDPRDIRRLHERIDGIEQRLDEIELRLEQLEHRLDRASQHSQEVSP